MYVSSSFFTQWKHSLEIVNAVATTSCQRYSPDNAICLEGNPRMKLQSFLPYGFELPPCFPGPPINLSQCSACPGGTLSSQQEQQSVWQQCSYFAAAEGNSLGQGLGSFHQRIRQLPPADQASIPPKPGVWYTSCTNVMTTLVLLPLYKLCSQDFPRAVSTALCLLPFIVIASGKKPSPPWLCTVSKLLVLSFLGMQQFSKYLNVIISNENAFLLQKVVSYTSIYIYDWLSESDFMLKYIRRWSIFYFLLK